MRIDYTNLQKVDITMVPYIENMLEELHDDMGGTSTTLAGNHLFTVNEEAPE
jgi:hypothetical protein